MTTDRAWVCHRRSLVTLAVLVVLAAGCGDDPATTTTAPTTAAISGRVYFVDQDTPVVTTVELWRGRETDRVSSARTDEDGYFSFVITTPDTYSVWVSVSGLLDECEGLGLDLFVAGIDLGDTGGAWTDLRQRHIMDEVADDTYYEWVGHTRRGVEIGDDISLADLILVCE